MRYVTIPAPVSLVHPNMPPDAPKPPPFTFAQLLEQLVWVDPRWRGDWAETFERVADLLSEAATGEEVELETLDHERVSEILSSAKISELYSRKLTRLILAVTRAPRESKKKKTEKTEQA